jgi:RND family efflux transporter MFP subunit
MKSTLLLITLASTLIACSKETPPQVKTERPAITQIVGLVTGENSNVLSGEIRARHEIDMGFRVNGKIVQRLVETGSAVKKGQILARLDPADAELQVAASAAQLQLADDELKRYRELNRKGFISQSALDAKETAHKTAAAQAGLLRNQADYTTLRAEHAGVISSTLADAGQVVSAGQAVLKLAQEGEIEVAIAIPEASLAQYKIGDTAEITLLADNSAPLTGRLRELAPSADPVSRTYAARIALNAAPKLALGMTARVRFVSKQDAELIVPVSAIYQQGAQTAVWIVAADHTVSLRAVQVAAYRDEGAVIRQGLKSGERIVSAGVHRLSAGEKIHIIEQVTTGAAR